MRRVTICSITGKRPPPVTLRRQGPSAVRSRLQPQQRVQFRVVLVQEYVRSTVPMYNDDRDFHLSRDLDDLRALRLRVRHADLLKGKAAPLEPGARVLAPAAPRDAVQRHLLERDVLSRRLLVVGQSSGRFRVSDPHRTIHPKATGGAAVCELAARASSAQVCNILARRRSPRVGMFA